MEDLLEQANEIQESLGRSYAVPDELDEADLEAGEFRTAPQSPYPLSQSRTRCPRPRRRRRGTLVPGGSQQGARFHRRAPTRSFRGMFLVPDLRCPDVDVLFLSRPNPRQSRPVEGGFRLRLYSRCFRYNCVDPLCNHCMYLFVPPEAPVRDRRGIGQAITSPPPSRLPRCYRDRGFTKRPLSPERVYRNRVCASARLSRRSPVKRRRPRTRPPQNLGTVPRE